MVRITKARTWIALLVLAWAPLTGASPHAHPAPVTIVSIPWATATIDGGGSFVVPGTVLLEPGEYRLRIERQGYSVVEQTLRVTGSTPQSHIVRLGGR